MEKEKEIEVEKRASCDNVPVIAAAVREGTEEAETNKKDQPQEEAAQAGSRQRKDFTFLLLNSCVVLLVVVVILAVFLSRNNEKDNSLDSYHYGSDWSPGNVKIVNYTVQATIDSRYATTSVKIVFKNLNKCRAFHYFTMQLPITARITSLKMQSLDCVFDSHVLPEEDAHASFNEQASEGKPAAIISSSRIGNYQMEVSLPALESTTVELRLEELLQRRSSSIPFLIPFSPDSFVDYLRVDISVHELEAGLVSFEVEPVGNSAFSVTQSNNEAQASFQAENVASGAFPRLVRGSYDSSDLPENGLLVQSENCLLHLFNPGSNDLLQPIPRNIVFVIDVSGSMADDQKLEDVKEAFTQIVSSLIPDDYFAIHTFSELGTNSMREPALATAEDTAGAVNFIQALTAEGGTNLTGAILDGILTVKGMQAQFPEKIPIVIVLTDGQPTVGDQYPPIIASKIREANAEVQAKIYSLGFGYDADLNLLKAIAIQNQGRAVEIFEGFFDDSTVDQIEAFYQGELGTIILSDIVVRFDGIQIIDSHTQTRFPVLEAGSEVAVRAIISSTARALQTGSDDVPVNVTTTATSPAENWTWSVSSQLKQQSGGNGGNECIQSYTQAQIAAILEFRDACLSVGDSDMVQYAPFAVDQNYGLVGAAEAEALRLALNAEIVWPGLTALVTIQSESCSDVLDEVEVCRSGDGIEGATMANTSSGTGRHIMLSLPLLLVAFYICLAW